MHVEALAQSPYADHAARGIAHRRHGVNRRARALGADSRLAHAAPRCERARSCTSLEQRLGRARLREEGVAAASCAPSECPARPSGACPVSARIGMCLVRSSPFSRRVASQPSMTGRERSMTMRSGRIRVRRRDRLGPVARLCHPVAGVREELGVHLPVVLVVVDDQDAGPLVDGGRALHRAMSGSARRSRQRST